MRISCIEGDPGFHPHFNDARIWLAGAQRSNVVTADEKGRFALTYRLDEFGNVRRDPKTNEPLTDRFYGDVRIEVADWLRAAMEAPQEEDEGALGAAIRLMIATP